MAEPHNTTTEQPSKPSGLPTIDINEYGGKKDGERQSMNKRLFMQLIVLDTVGDHTASSLSEALHEQLARNKIPSVLYADANSPRGVGLLTWSDDPGHFVKNVHPLFRSNPVNQAVIRNNHTMLGRTYSNGYEPDLAFVLLERPVRNVLNAQYPWHVWYPLRRSGAFARLTAEEQGAMMREHAQIGHAYGQQELAHDVRLACHGIDANDNEFVIGLVGKELHPLSHLVQSMRKTRQTSEFIIQMGPFFVGYVTHRVLL